MLDRARHRAEAALGMIDIAAVSKVYDTTQRGRHLALTDVSLRIQEGQFVSILGPSGCGKSTLLYMVGGFIAPTTGVICVKEKPVSGPGPDRGPVFQEFALFPWKTVLGNVMYGPLQQRLSRARAEKRAREL